MANLLAQDWIWCPTGGGAAGWGTSGEEYRTGYQTFSMLLVKRDHPDWTDAHCFAEAKIQFEAAATHWLVATLELVKSLAPSCHWGYFGGPSLCAPYYPCASVDGVQKCGFDHPTAGPPLRALAAKQRPVQEASMAAASKAIFTRPCIFYRENP
jgi:hypothetical protein